MFQKNEHVFYESEGICLVADILISPLSGMPEGKRYYLLHPISNKNRILYVPVDSDKVYLRRILNRKEAEELVNEIPKVEEICEEDSKKLRTAYADLLKTHLPENWIRIIKTVYRRLRDAMPRGQRISDTERNAAESAKRFLHAELALALELNESEIEGYIRSRIDEPA